MNHTTDLYLEFTDAGNIIRLEPINLMYPKSDLDRDRNLIKTKVTIKASVFSRQYIAEVMTTDFEIFKRQLIALDQNFNGSAKFEPLEEQLVLIIKGDGIGHFEVDCIATPESHLEQTLTFSLSFDQTEIKEYVRQLEAITCTFPIDGDFKISKT